MNVSEKSSFRNSRQNKHSAKLINDKEHKLDKTLSLKRQCI